MSRRYLSQLEGGFYASLKVIGRLAEALEGGARRTAENAGATEQERRIREPPVALSSIRIGGEP